MNRKPKILFLSTGNSTRSQMAEGFLRALAGDQFDAVSAGIEPGELNPLAVEVMKEAGIDISKQQSKNVAESLKEHFGYVITVCNMARERAPIFPFTPNLLHWSLEDPSAATGSVAEKKTIFRRVRDEIRDKVKGFVSEIAEKNAERASAASA
jgi:arsenate reductase (thioredoxin)